MTVSSGKIVLFHVLGCLLFLAIPVFLFPRPPEDAFSFFSSPTQRDFLANALMLLVFYLNYYVLIPRFYFHKKYVSYALAILIAFALIAYSPTLLTQGISYFFSADRIGPPVNHHPGNDPEKLKNLRESSYFQTVSHIIFLFFSVILFSVLLRVRQRFFTVQTARQKAELLLLKAQINPHFLFNALNNIYSLTLSKSDEAADAVIQLSKMMRYLLRNTTSEYIELVKEMEYISGYLNLQALRLGDSVAFRYSLAGEYDSWQIAPLILMPFIENAFKYGVNPDQASEIKIDISVAGNVLSLYVFNLKVKTMYNDLSNGIGVENTRERLDILYKNRYKLLLIDLPESFTADLTIEL